MNIDTALTSSLAKPNPALQLQALFQGMSSAQAPAGTRESVRMAAGELVAGTLILPMFRMMRQDPLNSDLIPVSSGEKTFQQMLDSEMARHIVQAARLPLVDALTDRFMRNTRQPQQHQQQQAQPATSSPPPSVGRTDRHA